MPATRLKINPCAVSQFDVAGLDSAAAENFIRHVGLTGAADQALVLGKELALVHMAPPLLTERKCVDAIGCADLDDEETSFIKVFVDELRNEFEAAKLRSDQQYIIAPHYVMDLELLVPRFSCAGFVIQAYREAEIDLVETDESRLPSVTIETLCVAYPDQEKLLRSEKVRTKFGLSESGPWNVLLAGYVLNALNRTRSEIRSGPYTPKMGDECFPSKEK